MTPILRRFPRWVNRLYAKAFGYFWIPCPICGRDFGGHEIADEGLLDVPLNFVAISERGWVTGNPSKLVCWRCAKAVRRHNSQHLSALIQRAIEYGYKISDQGLPKDHLDTYSYDDVFNGRIGKIEGDAP